MFIFGVWLGDVRGWVWDLVWFVGLVVVLVVYGVLVGVPWPIAVVSSYSMEPTMRVGDFIVLTGASCQSVNVGDVLYTWLGTPCGHGNWIIHRVYQEEGNCKLKTWGDNNPMPDQLAGEPPVSDNIVGKVLFTVPYVGVFPLVARPQGVGAEAMAAWLGRIAVFSAMGLLLLPILQSRGAPEGEEGREGGEARR
jgi:signal peptidase